MTQRHKYECENGHKLDMNQPIDVCRVLRCEAKLKAVGPGSRKAKNRTGDAGAVGEEETP